MIQVRFAAFEGSLADFTECVRARRIPMHEWHLLPIARALREAVAAGAPRADGDLRGGPDAQAADGGAPPSSPPPPDSADWGHVDFQAAADALEQIAFLIAWRRRYLFQPQRRRRTSPEAVRQLRRLARLALAAELERIASQTAAAEPSASGGADTVGAHPLPPPTLSPRRILGLLRRVQEAVLSSRAQELLRRLARERWRVSDKLGRLLGLLSQRERVVFEQLLHDRGDPEEVVVSLLAVLDAAKGGRVRLEQARHFAPIVITRREDGEAESAGEIPLPDEPENPGRLAPLI